VRFYLKDDDDEASVSNSAKEVREKLLNSLKGCKIQKEKVTQIITYHIGKLSAYGIFFLKKHKNFTIYPFEKNNYILCFLESIA
jgi:hypothetical protein